MVLSLPPGLCYALRTAALAHTRSAHSISSTRHSRHCVLGALQTLSLPDGRQLAWAEAGCPFRYPCFMFHGYPGSRLEARDFEDIGPWHNVRFVCPDRPGYGLSTIQPDRRILDWPADVQFLARHLNMKR